MKVVYIHDAVYLWEACGVLKRMWELATRLAGDHDEVIARINPDSVLLLPTRRESFGIPLPGALAYWTWWSLPSAHRTRQQNSSTTARRVQSSMRFPQSAADGVVRSRTVRSEVWVEVAADYDWDIVADRTETSYEGVSA